MEFQNECYECSHKWDSENDDDPCPVCEELENVGTDYLDE